MTEKDFKREVVLLVELAKAINFSCLGTPQPRTIATRLKSLQVQVNNLVNKSYNESTQTVLLTKDDDSQT